MSGITYKEAKSVIIANKVKQLFIHGEYDYHHDFTDEECEEVFKEAEAICEQEDAFCMLDNLDEINEKFT